MRLPDLDQDSPTLDDPAATPAPASSPAFGPAPSSMAAPPGGALPAVAAHPSNEPSLRHALAALLPEMRGFARFLARDRSRADDLVQDTLVRALAALPQFQPGTNLKAWVFTIQRNAFYEQARRTRREESALRQRFADEAAEGPPQESRTDLSDLQRLLFALPPLLREALVLVGAQELSHEAAAAICGVPVGTMKARVSRGRAKLAAIMGRRVDHEGPDREEPGRGGEDSIGKTG